MSEVATLIVGGGGNPLEEINFGASTKWAPISYTVILINGVIPSFININRGYIPHLLILIGVINPPFTHLFSAI